MRPLERGQGVRIVSALADDDPTPPAIRQAALDGLDEAAQTGPGGHPMEDVEATLLSVGFRDDAQPEVGVKVAAAEAFQKAVAGGSPLRLEPVMAVDVSCPRSTWAP